MGISTSTLGLIFGGIGAAASIYSATQSKPQQPALQAPIAPPASQTAKTPEQNVYKTRPAGAGGGTGTPSADSTLLTGPGGVSNDLLTLGKATLLGS